MQLSSWIGHSSLQNAEHELKDHRRLLDDEIAPQFASPPHREIPERDQQQNARPCPWKSVPATMLMEGRHFRKVGYLSIPRHQVDLCDELCRSTEQRTIFQHSASGTQTFVALEDVQVSTFVVAPLAFK